MAVKNQDPTKPDGFVWTVLFLIFESELLPGTATGPRSKDYGMLFEIKVSRDITNVHPKLHEQILKLKDDKKFCAMLEEATKAQVAKFETRVAKDDVKLLEASNKQQELVKEISAIVLKDIPEIKFWG